MKKIWIKQYLICSCNSYVVTASLCNECVGKIKSYFILSWRGQCRAACIVSELEPHEQLSSPLGHNVIKTLILEQLHRDWRMTDVEGYIDCAQGNFNKIVWELIITLLNEAHMSSQRSSHCNVRNMLVKNRHLILTMSCVPQSVIQTRIC